MEHPSPSSAAPSTVGRLLRRPALAAVVLQRLPFVELDWDERQKSRFAATDSTGRRLEVFLPRGQVVRGGDVLMDETGAMIRVVARAQKLMRVVPCPQHGRAFDLVRAAYHLGNRHVPLELSTGGLQFEPDPVLADLLRSQHLVVQEVSAPFEPEGGAYGDHGGAPGGHPGGHSGGHHSHHAHASPHTHHDHRGSCNHGA